MLLHVSCMYWMTSCISPGFTADEHEISVVVAWWSQAGVEQQQARGGFFVP